MRKTIETINGSPVIHTVNGVDTRTGAVYVREVPVTTPLPNGFNQELAELVFDRISMINAAAGGTSQTTGDFMLNGWFQGDWRTALPNVGTVAATLGIDSAPACGTAMCFAGWVGELTAADWVADGTFLATRRMESYWMDIILMTRDAAAQLVREVCFPVQTVESFYPSYKDMLRERGFTSQTHTGIRVSHYALWALGLKHGDYLGLFDGGNSISTIRSLIDLYVEFGPTPNLEAREQGLKAQDRECYWEEVVAVATANARPLESYLGYDIHRNCQAVRG